ncbi:L,D-transpeptidase [Curtobacterium sp. Leaf261]|uniref:L,D-transpeptidase n=1 Tax=Curtobacterium sp. Leaf261 TaxID=1736311 RepID=UPI0006FB060B|nr:L,D-transpeptidase [Curtobacterium sp. Leaf261]KQO61437.1 hypothetical protein ASF23_13290 [Curtobacterium sp. Leaf261]
MTSQNPSARRRTLLIVGVAIVLLAVLAAFLIPAALRSTASPAPSTSASTTSGPSASARPPYRAPDADTIAALPEARYNAVIGGLLPYYESGITKASRSSYTISADAPLYGADQQTAVARLAAKNFLNEPTVVVPVRFDGPWALVLTPSRQQLPSVAPNGSAAQTVAWMRKDLLTKGTTLEMHVSISVSKQTVSIVDAAGKVEQSFPAGVGASGTPTPTGVVGYIEARYLDPAQNQTVHPINLTSLHSAAADEPYGGEDGGLIGVHYEAQATGDISHGCVRLSSTGVDAVNQLPLGTLVEITA